MSVLKQLVFTPRCLICSRLGVDFCISCVEKVKPFRARDLVEIDLCICAGEYSDWLRDSIICYKNGDAKYTKLLSHLLQNALESLIKSKNLTLIPIPSSSQKIRERGFDAVANLCTNVIKGSESVTMDTSNLYLRRAVLDQVGLTALQRQENLSGAFGVRRVLNGTVVIVDDVITTGATLNSAAKALKHAGAQRVFALALCGTPKTR
jgi:ComF family protein